MTERPKLNPKDYFNFSLDGIKESKDKLNYELDFEFIEQIAQRMSTNKGKYKPYNWQNPIEIEGLKQALFRHTIEIMKDNYEDDGREFGHLEAVALNAMMISYQLKNKVQSKQDLKEFNLSELVNNYPSDMELGAALRKLIR